MIETIYNRITGEVNSLLADIGYTRYTEQLNPKAGDTKYTIWWNKEEHKSVLFCWYPNTHEFELCRSFKKGKPKLKGFAWEHVYDDSYKPKAITRLEEIDIKAIVGYFIGELSYTLKRVPKDGKPQSINLAHYDKRQSLIKKSVLITLGVLLFIPVIVLGIKNSKNLPQQEGMQHYHHFPYRQAIDNRAIKQDKTASIDSTTN